MPPQAFQSPFDVHVPPGAEGWEEMYSWYHLSGEERQQLDSERFWFHDRLHHPGVLYPYDEIFSECWWQALGAFNTRVFAVPPAFGIDQRVVNGYLYASPVPVTDPAEIERRAAIFQERAGHYYEHWESIYEEWKEKTVRRFEELKGLDFDPLPDLEDASVVYEHRGSSTGYKLLENFHRMILTMYETFQWHFELLNLGYAAYLTFFSLCKEAFPEIPDQTISRMIAGLHIDLYRPDDELKRLAKEAVRLGIGDQILDGSDTVHVFATLSDSAPGQEWLEDWRRTADPWFRVATDPGHPGGYHLYKTWMEDQNVPLAYVKNYIRRLRGGEAIDRPTEEILRERDRITADYRSLLSEEDQVGFDSMLKLARRVMVYIEEHMLYIEHWIWSVFWQKSRQLAQSLTQMGYFDGPEDMFLLRRYEVMEALYDLVAGWSVASRPRGAEYWRPILAKRRKILNALKSWEPPSALGKPPKEVVEPFTILLWGITTDTIQEWLTEPAAGPTSIKGIPGAPGVVEGTARVIRAVEELDQIEEGDILICPATSPSWSPVFSRVAATVSDVGGIMSHTAIICREYGLPAVVGTGNAVALIKTGQRLRVDGNQGTVLILEEA